MYKYISSADLAGNVCFKPTFWQTKTRIHNLIDTYLTIDILCDRLEDLPEQFLNPQPRPWQPINWHNINSEQIIGIDLKVFLSIIKGALDTEAPIRGYTQTSKQYLQSIHPAMARFVGGVTDKDNTLLEIGLWEKEERQTRAFLGRLEIARVACQHTPALIKIYQQLAQNKIASTPPIPKSYQPSNNAKMDLYRHGIHRIATEYSAVCLYLWLMVRTTDSLQQVLQELLLDEINHMTKFWGFGQWLYGDFNPHSIYKKCDRQNRTNTNKFKAINHLIATVTHMMKVLHWESWGLNQQIELTYTFICVGKRMLSWSNSLTSEYLAMLFNSSLIADN